jgi:hypothetical protein
MLFTIVVSFGVSLISVLICRKIGLLSLVLILALSSILLSLPACGPQGAAIGQSLKTCELGSLPSALESVIADVTAILFGGQTSWQDQLTQLGVQVGKEQLNCVVSAVGSGLKARLAKRGQPDPQYSEAITRSGQWLAANP